jgi:hypothetical protein
MAKGRELWLDRDERVDLPRNDHIAFNFNI